MPEMQNNGGPGVPDEEPADTFFSVPEVADAIPSPASVLVGPGEIDAGSFLFSPGVPGGVVAGYVLGGDHTLGSIEDILRERADRTDRGKISKYDSFYLPQSPAPFGLWEYKCSTCRFFQEAEGRGDGAGACEVVGHEEDWLGGERVHPESWCALWMPAEGTKPFEYITDRVEGEARD